MILTKEELQRFAEYCDFRKEFHVGNAWAIENEVTEDVVLIALREHKSQNEKILAAMFSIVGQELLKDI